MVLAVTILTMQFGAMAGLVDLHATLHHAIRWDVLAAIVGGPVFGRGMTLAGNRGFGVPVRFGVGDLRHWTSWC